MRVRRVLAGAGLMLVAYAYMAQPAGAQAACTATVNGSDAGQYRSPKTALKVTEDDVVSITANAPGPGAYDVKLEFAGIQWSVASDTYDENSWSDEVVVNDYADKGAGIYKVVAVSAGPNGSCSDFAFFRITGVGPLSTVAGKAATGAAVLGLLGTAAGAVGARGKVPKAFVHAPPAPTAPAASGPPPAPAASPVAPTEPSAGDRGSGDE